MTTMSEITVTPHGPTQIDEVIDTEKQTRISLVFKCDAEITVSDGHHTMEELYEHRHALFIALCKAYDSYVTPLNFPHVRFWKSLQHHDGSSYEGWFILGISRQKIPFNNDDPIEMQHVAYHLPMKHWDTVDVPTLERAPYYDGYTPENVIKRLVKL